MAEASHVNRRWTSWLALSMIVVIAGALRFTALEFGGPDVPARPDEAGLPLTLELMSRGELFPPLAVYGGGFFYPLEAFVAVARSTGWLDPTLAWPESAFGVLLLGRIWSALVGTATVVVVFCIASLLQDRRSGLLAALLFAVATLPVRESHFAKADSAAAFAVSLFLLCLAVRWRTESRRAVGVGLGLVAALSTKASVGVVPAAGLALVGAAPRDWRSLRLRPLAIGVGVTIVGFFVLNQFWLTHPVDTWKFWAASVEILAGDDRAWFPGDAESPPSLAYHLQVSLGRGLGMFAAFLVVPALLLALYEGGRRRLVAVACLGQIAKLLSSPMVLARYALPVFPGLVVLVSIAVVTACDRVPAARAIRATMLAVAALVLVLGPAQRSFTLVRLLSRADTRELAGRWIEAHIPPDAVVISVGSPTRSNSDWGRPPLGSRKVLRDVPRERWRVEGAGWVVWHHYPLEYSREPLPAGFEERPRVVFDPFADSETEPVLEPLDAFYLPIGGLASVERPGPRIAIYELEPD